MNLVKKNKMCIRDSFTALYSLTTSLPTPEVPLPVAQTQQAVVVSNDCLLYTSTRSVIPTWASKVATLKGASLGFFFHETFNDFNDATDVIKRCV